MPAPMASADLAAAIIAQPCPLLFLDTAAILDFLRVPFRIELQVDIVDSAASIVDDVLADPRRIWLVTTANVMHEFAGRRDEVSEELSCRMRELNQWMARVSNVAKIAFPEWRIGSLDWRELKLEQRILGIMDRLVDSMVTFQGTVTCVGKARDRLWAGLPPASKAKQEFKDCEIFEEFLELLGVIRGKGFEQPAVFVTPNKKDYGPAPEGHPQIASELAALSAQYAANLSWARALVLLRTI
jgi:hypothetical protein